MKENNNVNDISTAEARDKLEQIAKDAGICMFVTRLDKLPQAARPMSVLDVDAEGNLWFFSHIHSNKNIHIIGDNRVQLYFANKSSSEYLSIYGEATILNNKDKIRELWTPVAKAWFHEGVDDPNITLLKIHPKDAYYWDTKSNKLVALIKIAVSAITGNSNDDGVEGKLKV